MFDDSSILPMYFSIASC